MIALIRYRAGNIASVSNALQRLEIPFYLADTPEQLEKSTGVIFPGVGHAFSAMESLRKNHIHTWLKQTTKPVLGICVGMQLLFESSEEGNTEGLGVLPGRLSRFNDTLDKVPHMGWNEVSIAGGHPLLDGIPDQSFFYFVHSYYAPATGDTIATCEYQLPFSAVVHRGNFYGVQFHPEKSGEMGARLLRNFADLIL